MVSREEDRLSDLPGDVLHKIMSFLSPLELARLRVQSKRLSFAWLSVPDLTLDSTHPDWLHHQDAFDAHARATILRRPVDPTLQSLIHCFFPDGDGEDPVAAPPPEMDSDLAVRRLEIVLEAGVQFHCWPVIRSSELSSPWLTSLKLTSVMMPVTELVVACPLLRHFYLHSCGGGYKVTKVRFSAAAKLIKSVSVIKCKNIKSISIDKDSPAGLLEFSYLGPDKYSGDGASVDVFNAATQESLKVLEMSRSWRVTGDWLREEVSKLVSLEKLGLRACDKLRSIFIGNPKLKHLVVEEGSSNVSLQVAVPGLETLSLKFEGSHLKVDGIEGCRSLRKVEILGGKAEKPGMMEALIANPFLESLILQRFDFNDERWVPSQRFHSTLRNAELDMWLLIGYELGDVQIRLRDVLSVFGRCNTLTLMFGLQVDKCIYPDALRETLIPPLDEVKEINITYLLEPENDPRMVELVDSVLWLSPRLQALSIIDDMYRTIFRIKLHRANTQHVDLECCSSAQMLCWRHDLTEVVIENCEDYHYQERLHKYFGKNVKVKVTVAFPKNVNKKDIRYRHSDMQDRIFI